MQILSKSVFANLIFGLAACLLLSGCFGDQDSLQSNDRSRTENGKPRVVAVSYPLQSLSQRLLGPTVMVEFPAKDAVDPSQWRPNREQIADMQTADLIVANGTGATYAKWLTTVSLPDSKRINVASKGLSLMDFIAVEDVRYVHSHGPEGEHSHATTVSRTWLSPTIASKQAEYLASELKKKYPNLAAEIDSHLVEIKQQLDRIAQPLAAQSEKAKRVCVFTATHDLKFMTQAAGVQDRHFAWDQNTSAQQVRDQLREAINTQPSPQDDGSTNELETPKIILIPSSLSRLSGNEFDAVFKELKIEPVEIDLLDLPTERGDFISRLEAQLNKLQAASF